MAVILESAHPYPADTDETKSATIPGAHHVFIAFNDLTELNPVGGDRIILYDKDDIAPWYGFFSQQLKGVKLSLLGDTVKVRLAGPTGGYYGYKAVVDDVSDVSGPYNFNPDYTSPIHDGTGYPGPYYRGADRYISYYDSYNWTVVVRKAGNAGASDAWTLFTIADAGWAYANPGSSPNKIRICYDTSPPNFTWVIGEWDMATDTWTEITRVVSVRNTTGYCYDPVLNRDYVIYRPTTQGRLSMRVFDGATWSDEIKISDNVPDTNLSNISTLRADENGDLHIFFRSCPNAWPVVFTLYYRKYKADGTFTPVVTIPTDGDTSLGRIGFSGNCVVAGYRKSEVSGFYSGWVHYGTDYHDDVPVFNTVKVTEDLETGESPQCGDGPDPDLAYIWWVVQHDPADPSRHMDQVEYRSFACPGPVLGPVMLFHDEVQYPSPANNVANQFLHYLYPGVWIEEANHWGLVLGMEYNPLGGGNQMCASGFYWFSGGVVPAAVARRARIFYRKPFFPPR